MKSPAQQSLKENILKMKVNIYALIKTEIKMTHKNSGAFTLDQKTLATYQENDVQRLQKVNFTLKKPSTKTPDFVLSVHFLSPENAE